MATANFETMGNFPLYARESMYCKVCPECGFTCGTDADKCEDCGASLEGVESRYDEWTEQTECDDVQREMDKFNEDFAFHNLTLKSGYYTGVQFFVEEKFKGGYDSIEDMDNDECRYYYGECRSKVLRRYNAEVRKVRKAMAKIAEDWGYAEYLCVGRFSNGEAVYEKVDPKKGPTLRQAAKMASA